MSLSSFSLTISDGIHTQLPLPWGLEGAGFSLGRLMSAEQGQVGALVAGLRGHGGHGAALGSPDGMAQGSQHSPCPRGALWAQESGEL